MTLNQKQGGQDFNSATGAGVSRQGEPVRIRAHTDLKKSGMSLGMKLHGIQNSREQLNQTTALTGSSQATHLSQGIQQFHSRGNSISAVNMGLGIPGQGQKRSQSVDKNSAHYHFNHAAFQQAAHFGVGAMGGQQQQPGIPIVNQSQPVPVGGQHPQSKDPKSPHFIHEAIERKIERFSRQRNRGGLSMGSSQTAQAVYN